VVREKWHRPALWAKVTWVHLYYDIMTLILGLGYYGLDVETWILDFDVIVAGTK